ncbi:putative ABC transporter permease [Anaerotruncus massiliensis (ex Togo et al. 2019)]|uniref:putative ABC transporter permease n=1 Tax=Anaerotruncus TaxID=244127 RepID=UPI000C77CBEE|nr:putative ABC transporter permease [Anaerotruncus massiliensis (ex Togo et al. 2019)]
MLVKAERYFLCFLSYSVLGWLYEVFLEVVVYRWGFSNRGVLFGPYCPIYGVGALVLVLSLRRLRDRDIRIGKLPVTPLLVFASAGAIATVIELIGSYVMELTTGGWMWDYRAYPLNFQGRIALNPSVRFGLGGLVILYLLQPLLERAARRLPGRALALLSGSLAGLMLLDAAVTFF